MPAKLDQLVRKCLAKEPANRYQTMEQLQTELKAIRRDSESGQLAAPLSEATTMVAEAPIKREYKWRGLLHSRFALGLSIVVLILAASVYLSVFRGSGRSPASVALSRSSPAYDTYMRGKVIVNSENAEDNEAAIKLLEQAIREDRNFAPAYADLARAYNRKAFYFAPTEAEKKQLNFDAEVNVEKALEIDPRLPEGYCARGLILFSPAKRFNHEGAIQSFKRALELNANSDDAYHQLGTVYFHIGLLDKGWAEIEKALAIKPDNSMARFRLGVINIYRTRYEDALTVFKSIPRQANPALVERNVATALFQLGRIDEASAVADEFLKTYSDQGGNVTSVKAMLLAKAGKTREAEETIQHAITIGRSFGHFHHTAYNIGSAYALMDKPEDAIRWVKAAADDGFPCYTFFEKDANLDSLRTDQRFIAFMTKLRQQWEEWQKTL
jgi:tetratricopeptide (TPR) repeat protein